MALIAAVLLVSLTRGVWARSIARSLTCAEAVAPSDAILVENFDPNYLVFERAAALQRAGVAGLVLVPTESSATDPATPDVVSKGIAEVMAGVARVQGLKMIPLSEIEPISLNAAYQIRDFLVAERVRSVIVVAPAFRSRRSSLVYGAVLPAAGIRVSCVPVTGVRTVENWTSTWHGIQEVTEQLIKLHYYRFYVLPFRRAAAGRLTA